MLSDTYSIEGVLLAFREEFMFTFSVNVLSSHRHIFEKIPPAVDCVNAPPHGASEARVSVAAELTNSSELVNSCKTI